MTKEEAEQVYWAAMNGEPVDPARLAQAREVVEGIKKEVAESFTKDMDGAMVEVTITFEFKFYQEFFPEVFSLPEVKMLALLAGEARDLLEDVNGEAVARTMRWVNGDPGHWEPTGGELKTEI